MGGGNFTASAPGAENPSYATASLAELCRGKLDTLLDNRMLRDAPAPAAAAAAAAAAAVVVGWGGVTRGSQVERMLLRITSS